MKGDKMGGYCVHVYKILTGKPEGKDNNIKMDLKKIGCEDMGWIQVAHSRVQWQLL
jgi:hypothetical protein